MSFVHVAKVSEIQPGTIKPFSVGGKKIALANVGGEFFAIDDTCTHEECSLAGEGVLDGSTVICGCHGASFDVTSGKVLSLPAPTDVSSYQVKVEGDKILVEL